MRRGWARLTGMRPAEGAGAAGARSCCPSCAAEMSKHPAGGGDGRGPRECGRVRRCLGSESPGLRSQALVPRPRLRGLYFSSPPPREITKTSPGPGPESLQQRWKPLSVHFDVGGWGLARPLWGASKGAAFARCAPLISLGLSALATSAQLIRTRLSLGGQSATGPRGDRACHGRGPGATVPERAVSLLRRPGDLARPRACFPFGPRGAQVAVTKRIKEEKKKRKT